MILNITAALIDHDQFDGASRLLTSVENVDERSTTSMKAGIQFERVFMLARQDGFDDARNLALKIDSIEEGQRGTALRTVALLQAKKQGSAATQRWASVLEDARDRAYALLGIAQALLGFDDPKLPYSEISIH